MPDIIDTAINANTFNTLVTAITTAGLDTALKGSGPFTVFAPTDEAFSKLPSGTRLIRKSKMLNIQWL